MAKLRYWSVRAVGATRRGCAGVIRAASGRCPGRWTGGTDRDKLRSHASAAAIRTGPPMSDTTIKPRTEIKPKTERPRLHKVILVNDDYTPREFVVMVLRAEFRMSDDQAYREIGRASCRERV
jgi:hypothetical protein